MIVVLGNIFINHIHTYTHMNLLIGFFFFFLHYLDCSKIHQIFSVKLKLPLEIFNNKSEVKYVVNTNL